MSGLFSFRWKPQKDSPRSNLVVFFSTKAPDHSELIALFDEDFRNHLQPDAVLAVGPNTATQWFASSLSAVVQNDAIVRFDVDRTPIGYRTFNKFGEWGALNIISGDAQRLDFPQADVQSAGLNWIFENRNVLLRPAMGLHFVHPSKVHSAGFLRTANALIKGSEVNFFAMTLLPHLIPELKRIWIDTSSIASIAYAMISLRQALDPAFEPPVVESFSSYEIKQKTLYQAAQSLVLISATQSGDLARLIMKQEALPKERVINLFSASSNKDDITVHCDVGGHPLLHPENGPDIPKLFSPEDCPYCRDGSRPVEFVTDQFLTDAITYSSVLVLSSDAPGNLANLMRRFAGHNAFVLERDPLNRAAHRFWIDVLALLRSERTGLRKQLDRAIARYIPAAASHLIALGDPASEETANAINDKIEETIGRKLVITRDLQHAPDGATAAVVAAGCIGSGNSLQNISRELREPFEASPRIYIALMAKYSQSERYRSFISDLTFNGSGFKHEVAVLEDMHLPHPSFLTAWTKEEEVLHRLKRTSHVDISRWVEERLAQLRQPKIGAAYDLFLRSPTGNFLKLRPGFAFWRHPYNIDEVSHGDVFVTIAAVLQRLRTRLEGQLGIPKLSHSAFHCSILAPGCFGRFNDGVIQASLLRAALPHELNYAGRPDLSAEMTRIIERVIELWEHSQGEACPEFLLALATKRMTLTRSDLGRIREFAPAQRLPPHLLELFKAVVP